MLDRIFSLLVRCSLVWNKYSSVLNPLYWIVVGLVLYLVGWHVMFTIWVIYSLISYVLQLRRYDKLDEFKSIDDEFKK